MNPPKVGEMFTFLRDNNEVTALCVLSEPRKQDGPHGWVIAFHTHEKFEKFDQCWLSKVGESGFIVTEISEGSDLYRVTIEGLLTEAQSPER